MIDLHSHILYDIDDGSRSLEMTMAMLKMSVDSGVTDIIATPHVGRKGVIPTWEEIVDKVEDLKVLVAEEGLPITIHPGAEVEINYETVEILEEGKTDYCLGNTNYVLLELTHSMSMQQAEELIYEVMLKGFHPILAHPERFSQLFDRPERLLELCRKGILLQANTGSFMGEFGENSQHRVEALLRNNLIALLGSDAHRDTARNTYMKKIQPRLESIDKKGNLWGEATENGRKLLNGEIFYRDVVNQWIPEKKSFFKRLFG